MEVAITRELIGKKPEEIVELNLDKKCTAPLIIGLNLNFNLLETLSLNGIGLASLENFPHLPRLKKLDLCDNNISGGLKYLVDAQVLSLTSLNLAKNPIRRLKEIEPLCSLENIQHISLLGCPVTGSPDYKLTLFWTLQPALQTLDGTNIRSIPFVEQEFEEPEDLSKQKSKPPPLSGKLYRVFETGDDHETSNSSFSTARTLLLENKPTTSPKPPTYNIADIKIPTQADVVNHVNSTGESSSTSSVRTITAPPIQGDPTGIANMGRRRKSNNGAWSDVLMADEFTDDEEESEDEDFDPEGDENEEEEEEEDGSDDDSDVEQPPLKKHSPSKESPNKAPAGSPVKTADNPEDGASVGNEALDDGKEESRKRKSSDDNGSEDKELDPKRKRS